MYKRETRFKGQKRVAVGRVTRNSDPSESKSKNSSRESSYEDSSKIKYEPNFNDGSMDVTVSGTQVNKLSFLQKYSTENKKFVNNTSSHIVAKNFVIWKILYRK